MVKEWFEEYRSLEKGKVFKTEEGEFVIYKGFKITLIEGEYRILDVRLNDFYSNVSLRDYNTLTAEGFVRGADMIMLARDSRRVDKHISLLEDYYTDQKEINKARPSISIKEYKRKLYSVKKNIGESLDKLFFFSSRKRQVESKYNIPTV